VARSFRQTSSGGQFAAALEALSVTAGTPGGVFFGGETRTGAADLRLAMAAKQHGDLPMLSWDAILDGSGDAPGSYIAQAGPTALGTYVGHGSLGPTRFDFAERYRAAYSALPDEYAAAGYACVEIITAALEAAAANSQTDAQLRDHVREFAVDPTHDYSTVLGTLAFDANGDSVQQFVTFYGVVASAAGGKGDWMILTQQDFGPAR
jgi:ABC-type branched-subunit amino acid transport system substrate-binding protein